MTSSERLSDDSETKITLNGEDATLAAEALKEASLDGPWPVSVRKQMVSLAKKIQSDLDD